MIAVLVPRRADGGRRDRVWAWVRDRWATEHPGYKIVEGHHDDGPFNRSAAINAAARDAGPFTVAVVADADSFCCADQITATVNAAARTGRMALAYDRFAYLSREMSDRIMGGYVGAWEPGVEWTMAGTCSSMLAISRPLWDEFGGFDEGFVGWGMEDVAASLAMQALGGGLERTPGNVWHLFHDPSTENRTTSGNFEANVERMGRYKACDYNPDSMRALLAELGST